MNTQQLVERLQRFASGGGGWVLWLMIATLGRIDRDHVRAFHLLRLEAG